jgi:hypothetical protein
MPVARVHKAKNVSRTPVCFKRIFDDEARQQGLAGGFSDGAFRVNIG